VPRKRPAAPGDTGYTRLQDGRWRARRLVFGKPVFREAPTRDGAKQKMDALLADMAQHNLPEPPKVAKVSITLPAFVDLWLDAIRPPVDPRSSPTYTAYEFHAKRLASGLPWRLREVTAADLQALYAKFADRPRSAQYLHKTARKMFKDAVAWGYLVQNTAATVPSPRYAAGEVCPPNPDELLRVLAVDTPPPGRRYCNLGTLRDFLVLMLHSGCRPSELIGLEWPDVNWSRSSITISKTRDGITGAEKPVKRKKSRREIGLSGVAMGTLRQRHESASFPLVFPNRFGAPLKVAGLRNEFKRLCAAVGLSGYTLYDLRHTHATQMLAAGMPLHELSWRLGHASVSITADVYSHKIQRKDVEWAEKLAGVLAP
jgi:integrase